MATTVTQDIASTYVKGKRAELRYTILEAADEAAAKTALDTVRPLAFNDIPVKESTITVEHFDSNNTAANIFRAAVLYYHDPAEAEHLISFDTTGGEQHITQSRGTTAFPGGSPDYKGAINCDGEHVAGVDIGIAASTFTERFYKSIDTVSEAYRKIIEDLTFTYNNATFRGRAAGEVLFKGAVGQKITKDGTTQWQIDYTFAVSPNRANFVVGDITGVSKLGWDYLWTLYKTSESANYHVKIPLAVYVEKIYGPGDFSTLALT